MKNKQIEKQEPCKHEETYVAVRHVSGLTLIRCKKCGAKV